MPFDNALVFGDEDTAAKFCQWVCHAEAPGLMLRQDSYQLDEEVDQQFGDEYTWALSYTERASGSTTSITNYFGITDASIMTDVTLTHIKQFTPLPRNEDKPILFCVDPMDLNHADLGLDLQNRIPLKYQNLIAQIPRDYKGEIILILPNIEKSGLIDESKIDNYFCRQKNINFELETSLKDQKTLKTQILEQLAKKKNIAVEHIPYFVTSENIDNRAWLRAELANEINLQKTVPKIQGDSKENDKKPKDKKRTPSSDRTHDRRDSNDDFGPPIRKPQTHWQQHKHKYLIAGSLLLGLGIAAISTIIALTGGSLLSFNLGFLNGGLLAQSMPWWKTGLISGGTALCGLLSGPMLVYSPRFISSQLCFNCPWSNTDDIEYNLANNEYQNRERKQEGRSSHTAKAQEQRAELSDKWALTSTQQRQL